MVTWDELSAGDKGLWRGVVERWWDWVDVERGQPIPFPKVFVVQELPANWTMAHVLHAVGVFDSITRAVKSGWKRPIQTGEFWFKNRTIRVLVVSVEAEQ